MGSMEAVMWALEELGIDPVRLITEPEAHPAEIEFTNRILGIEIDPVDKQEWQAKPRPKWEDQRR